MESLILLTVAAAFSLLSFNNDLVWLALLVHVKESVVGEQNVMFIYRLRLVNWSLASWLAIYKLQSHN
jgi:hypothetical protein